MVALSECYKISTICEAFSYRYFLKCEKVRWDSEVLYTTELVAGLGRTGAETGDFEPPDL